MRDIFPSVSMLIPRIKSGDESAWNSLCDKFRAGLISKTRQLIRRNKLEKACTADDLVQETFLKAWNRHGTFQGATTSQLASWLITILRNNFFDSCRIAQRELTQVTWFDCGDDAPTPSGELLLLEKEAELHGCLAELDDQCREVIVLRHFEGLKLAEIAMQTGLNINTVAGLCRRGIFKLSGLLNSDNAFDSLS